MALIGRVRRELERGPDLRLFAKVADVEAVGDDADDGMRLTAELYRARENLWIAREAACPKCLADEGDVGAVGEIFGGGEAAPHHEGGAEKAEVVGRDLAGAQLLRGVVAGPVERAFAGDADKFDDVV